MREIRLLLYIILGCIAVMAKDKPNVVFILSDDQSWDDYGFMGHPHLETPNLDQLAGEGFLYERGYNNCCNLSSLIGQHRDRALSTPNGRAWQSTVHG